MFTACALTVFGKVNKGKKGGHMGEMQGEMKKCIMCGNEKHEKEMECKNNEQYICSRRCLLAYLEKEKDENKRKEAQGGSGGDDDNLDDPTTWG